MKIRVKFSKHGAMKFIGHLDIMRYFQKAIRRAEIPIVFTEGFSPHMVMSFASPLGVGIESEGEYMDIEIKEPLSTEEAVRRLDAVMSEGMRILDFRQIPEEKASNAMALVAAADYRIRFRLSTRSDNSSSGNCTEGLREKSGQTLRQYSSAFVSSFSSASSE